MKNKMFDFRYTGFDRFDPLRQNDMPPTLYALMNSLVNYNAEEITKITKLAEKTKDYIFDFDYPLDNVFKSNFEITFLNHYMMRRIGFETFTAFKINLMAKLNEVMPKYNKMLEGFRNLDFLGDTEEHIRNETSSNETETTSTGEISTTNDNRYSDTPENRLADVRSGNYISDYTYNQGTNDSRNETSGQTNYETDENIRIIKKDSIDEYQKFMKVANSVYTMLFSELDVLFYGLI